MHPGFLLLFADEIALGALFWAAKRWKWGAKLARYGGVVGAVGGALSGGVTASAIGQRVLGGAAPTFARIPWARIGRRFPFLAKARRVVVPALIAVASKLRLFRPGLVRALAGVRFLRPVLARLPVAPAKVLRFV